MKSASLDYFTSLPALWLPLTVIIYFTAVALQKFFRKHNLVNPTLISLACIVGLLAGTGTSPQAYRAAVAPLDFLLGTCIVALAVPLYGLIRRFGAGLLRYLPALVSGSIGGTASGIAIAIALGVTPQGIATVAPKTATTGIAIEIARLSGGVPSAAALICIVTSLVGAAFGPWILRVCRATSPAARGLAYGTTSHGVGTAHAFTESEETGAWSTLAMCLNGILTALVVPALLALN